MTSVTFPRPKRGVSCGVMSHNGQSTENKQTGAAEQVSNDAASPTPVIPEGVPTGAPARLSHYPDLQSAPRFPIHLPLVVKSKLGESLTQTQNISSNGVLFHVDAEMPVGAPVDFTISLPADVLGAESDVRVDCRGRVVRSYDDDGGRGVGVVIDEYRFERR